MLRLVPLALALALMAALVGQGVKVAASARVAQRDAEAALAAVQLLQETPGDAGALAGVGPALGAAARSMGALREEVRPLAPVLALARPLPAQASWVADVPDALEALVPLVSVGASVAMPISAVAASDDTSQARLPRYLAAAASLSPKLAELSRELAAAEPALARLRGRPLHGPLARLEPAIERAAPLLPQAREALDVLEALGPALGMNGARTYLLLGQNNHEIRASGGFIGSAGAATVDHGNLVHLDYASSYTFDAGVTPPRPPMPLVRYLGLGGWYLRDANWWPDFPATAAQVEQAWQLAGRGAVDGVIGLDTVAIEALLRTMGPLDVPGYGRLEGDSFERMSAEQLYSRGALVSARSFHQAKSAFFGAVGRALVERMLAASPANLVAFGQELVALLDGKHVQLAFKDQRLIQLAHDRGWAGAITPEAGDSLLVVDTTVSYGDTYTYVKPGATLQVGVGEDGRVIHDLALSYANDYPAGLPAWMPAEMVGGETFDAATGQIVARPGFWGNWLRVYLPPTALEIAVDGLAEQQPVRQEFGRTLVEGYLPVAPGQRRAVAIRYVTDGGQADGRPYRIFLQKQAGLDCRPISLEVRWPGGGAASRQECPTGDQWLEVG